MPEPKYKLGDEIFILEEKVERRKIVGIVALFTQKGVFSKFKYWLSKNEVIQTYGWMAEEKIFATREELLASL